MTDWIGYFKEAAIGMDVSHVWRGYGSALFIEFGALTPPTGLRKDGKPRQPTGEIELMIEWSWRIEDERSIACGSWSGEKLWQPAFNGLIGRKVIDLTTFGRLPELSVSLTGGMHVVSFMTSEGDPAWTLFDRRGPRLITVTCRSGVIQEVEGGP